MLPWAKVRAGAIWQLAVGGGGRVHLQSTSGTCNYLSLSSPTRPVDMWMARRKRALGNQSRWSSPDCPAQGTLLGRQSAIGTNWKPFALLHIIIGETFAQQH